MATKYINKTNGGIKHLVDGAGLLQELFPERFHSFQKRSTRSLRWLRYRVAAGDLPSEKIGRARMFDVKKCRELVGKMIAGNGNSNPATKLAKQQDRNSRILGHRKPTKRRASK